MSILSTLVTTKITLQKIYLLTYTYNIQHRGWVITERHNVAKVIFEYNGKGAVSVPKVVVTSVQFRPWYCG